MPDINPPESKPDDLIADCVRVRREQLGMPADADRWGLAFSGGGIRSATVCLGFAKALASGNHLLRFDLVSSVSGGGYTAAMLGQVANGCADAQQLRERVAAMGQPDRDRPSWMQWWLRANGRYLIPSGFKDSVLAGATYLRNLLAIHIEVGLLAMLTGCLLAGLLLLVWTLRAQADWGATPWLAFLDTGLGGGFVPVPLLSLPLLLFVAVIHSLAYWAVSTPNLRGVAWRHMLEWVVGGCVVAWAGCQLLPITAGSVAAPLRWGLWIGALVLVVAWLIAWAVALRVHRQSQQQQSHHHGPNGWAAAWEKSTLTSQLALVLRCALAVCAAALVDRMAWALAFDWQTNALHTGVGIAVAVAVFRALLPKAEQLVAGRLSTSALMGLASVLGWSLAFFLLSWWVSLTYRMVLGAVFLDAPGEFSALVSKIASLLKMAAPPPQEPVDLTRGSWMCLALAVPLAFYIWATRLHFGFLNASSLHVLYRARLVRSYLGAANHLRFLSANPRLGTTDAMPIEPPEGYRVPSVSTVHAGDDCAMADYAPHEKGAPVHLINVCINQTTDPRGGLYNRDRRGMPLVVGPRECLRVGRREWVRPGHNGQRPSLCLGEWVAISGAAFAPGLGSRTRGGVSVLATLSGIRLGYWWDGLPLSQDRPAGVLPKQQGLLDELTGSFPGTERRTAYLTDGGHCENTGVYALLAENCQFIVALDCGADPDYHFADLENLIRRARIDMDIDITVLERGPVPTPQGPAGELMGAFGSLDDLKSDRSEARMALARIKYPNQQVGVMLIVKPSTWSSMPADLANYKRQHPEFPQQPTTDQFFDEDQWESYFKLGHELGQAVATALPVIDTVMPCFVEPPMARCAQGTAAAQPNTPSRVAARLMAQPVQTTLGVGAAFSAALAGWQAYSSYADGLENTQKDERAALKELTDVWAKLPKAPQASASSSAPETAPTAAYLTVANELAAVLARTSETTCTDVEGSWFAKSDMAKTILNDARRACKLSPNDQPAPACKRLLDLDVSGESCVAPRKASGTLQYCAHRYWAYDYAPDAVQWDCLSPARQRLAKSDLPPAPATITSSPAPTSPTPPADRPCKGTTVYLQVFGSEWRANARTLREPMRELGASVPPIEDVLGSAQAMQRVPPLTVSQPEVRAAQDQLAGQCATALKAQLQSAYPHLAPRDVPLPAKLKPRNDVIEIWLPPQAITVRSR